MIASTILTAEQRPNSHGESVVSLHFGKYSVRLASSDDDRRRIFRLRFLVFNLELNQGMEKAYLDGEDRDEFDSYCDHLLVEDNRIGEVVGTYRLQSGSKAVENRGFYSAREFDLSPYQGLLPSLLELGRACILRNHRSMEVLTLLWRAIAVYASQRDLRFFVGCSSISTTDPAVGVAMYKKLERFLVDPQYRTAPKDVYALPPAEPSKNCPDPPKLLRAYLSIGARICGPPAIDREFGTIDFLTLLDFENVNHRVKARFQG